MKKEHKSKKDISYDYVLIEFASLLEQQYHKSPSPSKVSEEETYHTNELATPETNKQ